MAFADADPPCFQSQPALDWVQILVISQTRCLRLSVGECCVASEIAQILEARSAAFERLTAVVRAECEVSYKHAVRHGVIQRLLVHSRTRQEWEACRTVVQGSSHGVAQVAMQEVTPGSEEDQRHSGWLLTAVQVELVAADGIVVAESVAAAICGVPTLPQHALCDPLVSYPAAAVAAAIADALVEGLMCVAAESDAVSDRSGSETDRKPPVREEESGRTVYAACHLVLIRGALVPSLDFVAAAAMLVDEHFAKHRKHRAPMVSVDVAVPADEMPPMRCKLPVRQKNAEDLH